MIERLRWRYAALLNKLPGTCWADLVSWVLDDRRERRERSWRERLGWTTQRHHCRADLARVGCCYCGKLRDHNPTVQEGHPR